MRTGAIFARGSCRALKWLALFGVVFALGAGEALAQTAEWELIVSRNLAEGQSLVPVQVNLKAPAVAAGVRDVTVTVTVTVKQLDDDELAEFGGAAEAVLNAMQPPVTRAELATAAAGLESETAALTDSTDVVWLPGTEATTNDPRGRVVGDVVIANAGGTATFTFDYGEAAADITHIAYLRTNRDSADAEDELFELEATATFSSGASVRRKPGDLPRTRSGYDHPVKIDDAQVQDYVITFPGDNDMTINEGMLADLELEAVPDRTVDLPFTVTLSALNDVTDYWLGTNPTTAGDPKAISQNYTLMDAAVQPFTVNTIGNDGDRMDEVVTVTARTNNQPGNQRDLVTFDMKVIDLHKLPGIMLDKIQLYGEDGKVQTASVDAIPEGMTGRVTLKADRSPTDVPNSEALTVTLGHGDDSTADTRDYTLNAREVNFSATGTTSTFNVDVDADEDLGVEEVLVLMATLKGSAANGPNPDAPFALKAIPFTDTTGTQISAKTYAEIEKARDDARATGSGDNGLWEPGETLTLMAADLFEYADTANVVLGSVVVEDPAILGAAAANDMVTITAKGAGTSPISITGTVVGASSSLDVTQTASNAVTVKFPISVDEPAITAKDNAQAVADAAVAKAAADSAHEIWEPSPNGATAMINLSDLFDVPPSIETRYLAESSAAMVGATVNDSTMMVELEPMAAGMAMITVTAVGIDRPGQGVSVDFNVEVMGQASVRAMPQATVDKVFMDAGAGSLMAGGDAVMVDMSMLYEVADGVTPTYTATSDMPDVLKAGASGTMLTLTPMSAGNAMVMVEAIDSGSQSIVSVMYDATVTAAGITYMLEGSMDMHIVEGDMDHANGTASSAMLTVTASAAVAADTEVMIMRDRGLSTAGDDDFMVEPLVIKAGETMGSAMVTATDDGMDERMEELVLYAMVDGMEADGDVKLYIWDAAVPALPVIAQLLLAAFLAIGGYRRYLRR